MPDGATAACHSVGPMQLLQHNRPACVSSCRGANYTPYKANLPLNSPPPFGPRTVSTPPFMYTSSTLPCRNGCALP